MDALMTWRSACLADRRRPMVVTSFFSSNSASLGHVVLGAIHVFPHPALPHDGLAQIVGSDR
jgi:hypothetical protein